jgi:hypothetical protein
MDIKPRSGGQIEGKTIAKQIVDSDATSKVDGQRETKTRI